MDAISYSLASKVLVGANTLDANTDQIDNTSDINKPVSTLQQELLGTVDVYEFVASGAISSGDVVSLNANGTVSVSTTPDAWIGLSKETVADAETLSITLYGGANYNQTGLTINTKYFVDTGGGITTTDTGYLIGKALSATSILIEGVS